MSLNTRIRREKYYGAQKLCVMVQLRIWIQKQDEFPKCSVADVSGIKAGEFCQLFQLVLNRVFMDKKC